MPKLQTNGGWAAGIQKRLDIDPWMFIAAATLFVACILFNGFPFITGDATRYVGAHVGDANAPVLLNFLARPLYTLFGFWGTALLNIVVTSYALARLSALQLVPYSRVVILVAAALSSLFVFAGLVGPEVWLLCAVVIVASIALGRPWTFIDVFVVAAGAAVHNSHPLIVIGLLAIGFLLNPARFRTWLVLFVSILCVLFVNDRLFAAFHPQTVPLRYSIVASEWLTRSPELFVGFCRENPSERICTEPYYSFMLKYKPKNLTDTLYFWGPSSPFRAVSELPEHQRFSAGEFEAVSTKIVDYSVRHPGILIGPMLQKLIGYWDRTPPEIWFSEYRVERWTKEYPSFYAYHRSLHRTGKLYHTDFNRTVYRIALLLYLPAIGWFALMGNWRAVKWAIVGGAAIIMNLAVILPFGPLVGRYVFKLLFIPVFVVCGMFADMIVRLREKAGWPSWWSPSLR